MPRMTGYTVTAKLFVPVNPLDPASIMAAAQVLKAATDGRTIAGLAGAEGVVVESIAGRYGTRDIEQPAPTPEPQETPQGDQAEDQGEAEGEVEGDVSSLVDDVDPAGQGEARTSRRRPT